MKEEISEESFLLLEMQYTLVQLDFQLEHAKRFGHQDSSDGSFEEEARKILLDLLTREMNEPAFRPDTPPLAVAEPSSQAAAFHENQDLRTSFRSFRLARKESIATLSLIRQPWSDELLERVRDHVASDRLKTTEIADLWRRHAATPSPGEREDRQASGEG